MKRALIKEMGSRRKENSPAMVEEVAKKKENTTTSSRSSSLVIRGGELPALPDSDLSMKIIRATKKRQQRPYAEEEQSPILRPKKKARNERGEQEYQEPVPKKPSPSDPQHPGGPPKGAVARDSGIIIRGVKANGALEAGIPPRPHEGDHEERRG